MHEQKITWAWALRIIWAAVWRWIIANVAAVLVLATIVVLTRRMGGPDMRHSPALVQIEFFLLLVCFVWGFGTALRSRHGGYRLTLVSTNAGPEAFD